MRRRTVITAGKRLFDHLREQTDLESALLHGLPMAFKDGALDPMPSIHELIQASVAHDDGAALALEMQEEMKNFPEEWKKFLGAEAQDILQVRCF